MMQQPQPIADIFDGENYLAYKQQGKMYVATYDEVERAIKSHNTISCASPYWDTDQGQEDMCIIRSFRFALAEHGFLAGSHTELVKE